MFKKVMAVLVVLSILLGSLWVYLWNKPESNGRGFFARYPVIQPLHLVKDLAGLWTSYSSLSEAWQKEKKKLSDQETTQSMQGLFFSFSAVLAPQQIILPSDERFTVAAKGFHIQNQWNTKRIRLTLGGVRGRAEVFLNGIDSSHKIGTLEGGGSVETIWVESARFDFTGENVLLIQMNPGTAQNKQVLGGWNERGGEITGPLLLEALPEVNVGWENLSVVYNTDQQEILLLVDVDCAKKDELTVWQLTAELLRDKTLVGQGSVAVQASGGSHQRVSLTFSTLHLDPWHPDNPVLYDLRILLSDGSGIVESLKIPLGFAQLEWENNGSWILNGEALPVQGIALTREQAAVLQSANAVENFLRARKEKGDTIVYMIDYADEYWLNAADCIGIGLWCELPVTNTMSGHLTVNGTLEQLLLLGQRHPSLLAWTILKGAATDGIARDVETQAYFDTIGRLAGSSLIYEIVHGKGIAASPVDSQTLSISEDKLSGIWGEIQAAREVDIEAFVDLMVADAATVTDETTVTSVVDRTAEASRQTAAGPGVWSWEKVVAPICLIFLFYKEVMNKRIRDMPYEHTVTTKRFKRWDNSACRTRFLTFAGGMAVLAALCFHIILSVPVAANSWMPYPWGFLARLQDIPSYLLWITLCLLLVMFRLLQLGLASPGFKHSPDAIILTCWLEQYCGWRWAAAMGWVWLSWGGALWVALLLYLILFMVALPRRLKTYRQIEAEIKFLWFLPAGMSLGVVLFLLLHISELLYCWRMFA